MKLIGGIGIRVDRPKLEGIGTLGCMVRLNASSQNSAFQKIGILTSSFVVHEATVDDPQPRSRQNPTYPQIRVAKKTNPCCYSCSRIGIVYDFVDYVEINTERLYINAATILLDDGEDYSPRILVRETGNYEIDEVNEIAGVAVALANEDEQEIDNNTVKIGKNIYKVGDRVYKVGVASGLKFGEITKINYVQYQGKKYVDFYEVLGAEPSDFFGRKKSETDSGAVVIHINSRNVIGVLQGGSSGDWLWGNRPENPAKVGGIGLISKILDISVISSRGAFSSSQYHSQLTASSDSLTELTSVIGQKIQKHYKEVIALVNKKKPVMVAWQRYKGPTFINLLLTSYRNPENKLAKEIDGIKIEDMFSYMQSMLEEYGSEELRIAIKQYGNFIISSIKECSTGREFIEKINKNFDTNG